MTLQEAIAARHSVRQYLDKQIEPEKVEQLQASLQHANAAAGLHLQLVANEPAAFAGGLAKYGRFSGVANYIALIGPKGSDEQIGYWGEQTVLLAQTLGLNSCWVGLTFRKQPSRYTIEQGETLFGVIALGYGVTQGAMHPVRPMEKYYKAASPTPQWFLDGMKAAMLAPTAMHEQKFELELLTDGSVKARTKFSLAGTYLKVDLGIVKCHFEIGAGAENVRWVD